MESSYERIASALEKIAEDGIDINCHIKFPTDPDKFVLDLAAMKLSDAIDGVGDAITYVAEKIEEMGAE